MRKQLAYQTCISFVLYLMQLVCFRKLVGRGTHTMSGDHKDFLRDSPSSAVTDSAEVEQACDVFLECGLFAFAHTGSSESEVVAGHGDSLGMPKLAVATLACLASVYIATPVKTLLDGFGADSWEASFQQLGDLSSRIALQESRLGRDSLEVQAVPILRAMHASVDRCFSSWCNVLVDQYVP